MKPTKDYEIMLFKAERDYQSGKVLYENELEEGAIYHYQQAAEKALKAFLIFNKNKVPKTHDLTSVLDICVELNSEFEVLYDACEKLTPYATIFRYMDTGYGLTPTHDIVDEAKNEAFKILQFVKNMILD
ncbi:MAG: HEPN domain-containing protein [Cetobacterium sp.]|uniref:HEPN domain-containing protein n=1 Tax=Cetobacterium sp. TaxID=2071632 RepID=UPI003EE7E639